MIQKFLQKAKVIRLVKVISAFRKQQIHYHLYQRHPLNLASCKPAASSPPTIQLYHKCISSPAKRHSSSSIAAECVQPPEGPTETSSYPGWLYNPVPFLRGLSLREEQKRRLEGRKSSSATRTVRLLPAVAKLFVISTRYEEFCICVSQLGILRYGLATGHFVSCRNSGSANIRDFRQAETTRTKYKRYKLGDGQDLDRSNGRSCHYNDSKW